MNEKSARKLQLSRRIDGMHPAAAWSIRVASNVFDPSEPSMIVP